MALTPATNRQVPDHSILDHFNKQTYLGNRFHYGYAPTASGTTEVARLLLTNPALPGTAQYQTALFVDLRSLSGVTAASTNVLRAYIGPTATAGTQTAALVADSAGSLNSTYFLLNSAGNTDLYYVWITINSAGVDPAVPGRTGIAVAGATNVSAATLGAAMVTAINSAAPTLFTCSGTSTVTITNSTTAAFTPIVDGTAATGFTFAVTSAGLGTAVTPLNMRPASPITSVAGLYTGPTVSANGSLYETLAAAALTTQASKELIILDPGKTLLITVQTATSAVVALDLAWSEI